MKRHISVLACLLMLVAIVFALASCVKPDAPHVHKYESSVTKEATCTENGEETFACKCGDVYVNELEATGHPEDAVVEIPAVAPTCTETGKAAGKKCSACGTVLVAQATLAATGHTPDVDKADTESCVPATICVNEGCDKVFVEAVKHDVTLTCREGDTCANCGEYVDALGHDVEDGVCKVCGANIMSVTTTDTYGWFDLYTFAASAAGNYTFYVPAGLGFYSQAAYDDWANAEVDFYFNSIGDTCTFTLGADEELEFYVGALTKGDWALEWSYEMNILGSYIATDEWGNTKDIVIDEDLVTITFVHPMMGYEMTNTYTYTCEDGVLALTYDDGTAVSDPSFTVVNGVLTAMTENGTEYAITEAVTEEPVVEGGFTGTYLASDAWGNSFEVVITDDTISFTPPRSPEVVWTYEFDGNNVTLYVGGSVITMPFAGSITATNGIASGMIYNGTEYTLTKTSSGSDEATFEGNYSATDTWGNSFEVVITDDTISFTPPRSPEVVWTYEFDGNNVTLYVDGSVITMPFAGSITVTDGIPSGMIYNGTEYTLTRTGASGGNTPSEADGSYNDPFEITVPGDIEVDYSGAGVVWHSFTASANGTVTVTFTITDTWLQVEDSDSLIVYDYNKTTYTFDVVAGEEYMVGIATWSEDGTAQTIAVNFALQ